jgi:hypothetical protein
MITSPESVALSEGHMYSELATVKDNGSIIPFRGSIHFFQEVSISVCLWQSERQNLKLQIRSEIKTINRVN